MDNIIISFISIFIGIFIYRGTIDIINYFKNRDNLGYWMPREACDLIIKKYFGEHLILILNNREQKILNDLRYRCFISGRNLKYLMKKKR